ncbi:MAG TPA: DegV family protein [Chloroflexia bacterium]|nr:DegV family protein [Chloroflexia bacterium]
MQESGPKKGSVGIVVDSVADIPEKYIQELDNVRVVPFHVYFQGEGKEYLDGVNITAAQFYEKLQQGDLGMPKTQGPSQGEYLKAYEEMLEKYDRIISLNMSSKMSVAYNSAQLARQMLPDKDITLVDSQTASMVLGLYAIQAARMAKAGATVEEIVKKVEYYKEQTVQLYMVGTLKYLRQSGRVNQVAYLLGTFLKVKPILTFKNGMGEPAGRELSIDRAYLNIVRHIVDKYGERPIMVAVVHSAALEQAEKLKELIMRKANVKEMIISEIGPTVGAHGGPGMVGATTIPLD